jgi:hypothetical protein
MWRRLAMANYSTDRRAWKRSSQRFLALEDTAWVLREGAFSMSKVLLHALAIRLGGTHSRCPIGASHRSHRRGAFTED